NGGGHDFLSNQVLGGLSAGTGNLGEPRNVNFASQDGDQFFTVLIPEPASLVLCGIGGLLLASRCRRATA
ncbi:MAG TPA: PEP-CTERM sorting domain-containing protein, partial [Phycisphaeraceae bacterium]